MQENCTLLFEWLLRELIVSLLTKMSILPFGFASFCRFFLSEPASGTGTEQGLRTRFILSKVVKTYLLNTSTKLLSEIGDLLTRFYT